MKRLLALTIAGLLLLALGGLPALAYGPGGAGNVAGRGPGNGPGAGTGTPVHDPSYVLAGTPFTHSGTVSAVGYLNGGGLTLVTDSGSVTLYGLGPWWYWEQQGVNWPQVGAVITATGYTVELDGVATNILMTVTSDGQTIQLRDPDTGWPLWSAGRNN